MKLVLRRLLFLSTCTIGALYIDGQKFCDTLEPITRELEPVPHEAGQTFYQPYVERLVSKVKVKGKTAIPYGQYRILVTYSPKYQRKMPLVANVPYFSGVRIHPGNTHNDTAGCILVGVHDPRYPQRIGFSKATFDRLFPRLENALATNEPVTLEIV